MLKKTDDVEFPVVGLLVRLPEGFEYVGAICVPDGDTDGEEDEELKKVMLPASLGLTPP